MKSEVEDWLTELPPLDGADDEPQAEDGTSEDLWPGLEEESSLDDATAEDLVVDDGVEVGDDEPGREEDDESWEADVGEPELDLTADEEGDPVAGDAPALGESDLDPDDELPPSDDDAGEEGTTDPVEHSIDGELPALDADDEGDFEDTLLLEAGIEPAPADALRWADAAWEERVSSHRTMSWDLAEGDAVVALATWATPELSASVTLDRKLLISRGNGEGERAVSDLSAHLPALARNGEPFFLALSGPGRLPQLWVANRAGQLAESADLGQSWTECAGVGRPILGMATHENGSLSVLAQRDSITELLTSTDGARWFARRVSAAVRIAPLSPARVAWLAVHGSAVAIGDAEGVCISPDGQYFARIQGSAGATAGVFAGDTADAPLVFAAAPGPRQEKVRLVRVLHDRTAEVLAELTPPDPADERMDVPSVLALRWDASRQALSVGFPTFVAMWGPARKEHA